MLNNNAINTESLDFRINLVTRFGKYYIKNISDFKIYEMTTDFNEFAKFYDRNINKALEKITEATRLDTFNMKDRYYIVVKDNLISLNANEYRSYINSAFKIINKGVLYQKAGEKFELEDIELDFLDKKLELLGIKDSKNAISFKSSEVAEVEDKDVNDNEFQVDEENESEIEDDNEESYWKQ